MSTVVVKIGTSSLTNSDGVIDTSVIWTVSAQVADLRSGGHDVVVVTSGAIAAGLPLVGLDAVGRPSDAVTLQALSSVGQPGLMRSWDEALSDHGIVAGQILLAPHNFGDRTQYLHARSTLQRLMQLGVVPVINENDAVTDVEVRYGDNDRIAALVAHLIDADVLVLLTDTDGVLTADPRVDPTASLIDEIVEFDHELEALAGGAGTARGSGGMASKLMAAKIASWSGVRTVIAAADRPDVVVDAVAGAAGVGTSVIPRQTKLSSRKLWIAFASPSMGQVTVDSGARKALERGGVSLLAAGVVTVSGDFERRDAIEVIDDQGDVFAKGICRMSSAELAAVAGKSAAELADDEPRIVVHTDALVIIT